MRDASILKKLASLLAAKNKSSEITITIFIIRGASHILNAIFSNYVSTFLLNEFLG